MERVESVVGVEGAVANDVGLTTQQRAWLEHIQRCECEGLSFPKSCEREGLNVKRLYAPRRVLIAKGCLPGKETAVVEPPRFAAVHYRAHALKHLALAIPWPMVKVLGRGRRGLTVRGSLERRVSVSAV